MWFLTLYDTYLQNYKAKDVAMIVTVESLSSLAHSLAIFPC